MSLTRLMIGILFAAAPAGAFAQTGASDDRVSLPDGPGSLEGLGDNASVDANMGVVSQSVTMKVPTGYANMTPSVGLTYSSGAGSSMVGIGWSVAMPAVTRLTKRGLPEYDVADEFDAGGELVLLPGTDPPEYRHRFEGTFDRYTWHAQGTGDAGYWRVRKNNGIVEYYGATSDGTLVPEARLSDPAGTNTFSYYLVERVDPYDHRVVYSYTSFDDVPHLTGIGWVFVNGTPEYSVAFAYEDRTDLLSDGSPGWESVQTKRLSAVEIVAHGQVQRTYALTYQSDMASGGFSRLQSVTQYGSQGGKYPVEHTFEYSQALGVDCQQAACGQPTVVTMQGPPIGTDISTGRATLIDMNGDGLPDFVDTNDGGLAHRIFISELDPATGTHSLAPYIESSVGVQGGHDLASPFVQVLDINGDGFTDMLNAQTGEVLVNRGQGDWDPVALSLWGSGDTGGLPDLSGDFEVDDNELGTIRFIDYDNDRRIDIIRSRFSGASNETSIFRNTGSGAFQNDPNAMNIGEGFDADTLELNDMNGDGLLDPVQVLADQVRYRLNLGWGQWGPWQTFSGFSFTTQEAIDAELEDLNGDGLADLVLVAGNEVRYWLNRNGASFDAEQSITSGQAAGDLPLKDASTTVLFADMNGNGSSDVVWIDASGAVTYLEIFPIRPNLLTKVENGIGRVTEFSYATSAAQRSEDAMAGNPWQYPMPHPMTVLATIDEYDLWSNVHRVMSYDYQDGYYDGDEKAFQGYGFVQQVLPGDPSVKGGTVATTYDLGDTDTYRKGLKLTVDALDEAGAAISSESMVYGDCLVAGIPASGLAFDIRHLCLQSMTRTYKEGLSADQWVTTSSSFLYDGYGNATWVGDEGVVSMGGGGCPVCTEPSFFGQPCGPTCSGDEQYTSTEFADPTASSNSAHWNTGIQTSLRTYGVAASDGSPLTDAYAEFRFYYDGAAFEGLPSGQFDKGFLSRRTKRIDTAGATVPAARHMSDSHGNVIEGIDPNGDVSGTTHRKRLTYEPTGLRLITVERTVHTASAPYELRQHITYDPLWDKPVTTTGWALVENGNETPSGGIAEAAYDEFGRMVALARPGTTLASPSDTYIYDLASPISRTIARKRSVAGGPWDIERVDCIDGYGRTVQERHRVAEGEYLVSDSTVFNVSGQVQERFQPYMADSGVCETSPPSGVASTRTFYDAALRQVRRLQPAPAPGEPEPEQTWSYLPLGVVYADAEDNRVGGPHEDTPMTTWRNGLDVAYRHERIPAPGAAPDVFTLLYDSIGLRTGIVDPSGIRYEMTLDLAGRAVAIDDPDRGLTTMQLDAAGNVVRKEDAVGAVTLATYDDLNRMLAEWEEAVGEPSRVSWAYDRLPPGVTCTDDACQNLAGELAVATYPLGDGTFGQDRHGFNERGFQVHLERNLGGHTFTVASTYDNADRNTAAVLPSGLTITNTWDGMGRPTAVPGYITKITYDRHMVAQLDLANGVTTAYAFDDRDMFTDKVTTGPSDELLLSYSVTRNRLGHMLSVTDNRPTDGSPRGSASYTYDSRYRLVGAELDPDQPAWVEQLTQTWDGSARLTSKVSDLGTASPAHLGTITYGGSDGGPRAATNADGIAIAYDATGSMVAKGDRTFEWDHRTTLTRATEGGAEVARFGYDDAGLRVVKWENGSTTYYVGPDFHVRDGVAITRVGLKDEKSVELHDPSFAATFLSDLAPATGADDALTAQPDAVITAADAWMSWAVTDGVLDFAAPTTPSKVNELHRAYLCRLLDGDEPTTRYNHTDLRQNVVLVTDDNGVPVGRREYYPDGSIRHSQGWDRSHGYSGKERDASTGLVYYGARYLDPSLGRWTVVDPGFEDLSEVDATQLPEAMSVYGFNAGDPINNRDPDGREPVTIIVTATLIGVAGAISAGVVQYRIEKLKGNKGWSVAMKVGTAAAVGGASAVASGGWSILGTVAKAAAVEAANALNDPKNPQTASENITAGASAGAFAGGVINFSIAAATGDLGGVVEQGLSAAKLAYGALDAAVAAESGSNIRGHAWEAIKKKFPDTASAAIKKGATGAENKLQKAARKHHKASKKRVPKTGSSSLSASTKFDLMKSGKATTRLKGGGPTKPAKPATN